MSEEESRFKISVCLTNYNRSKLLYEAVGNILMDNRIDEIIISDDNSRDEIYHSVVWYFKDFPKVKIHRNEQNLDCYRNKHKAVSLSNNEWVCLWDSDNIFDKSYIDRLENLWNSGINPNTIYTPSFARPHFDFTSVSGVNITKANVAGLVHSDKVQTMLNAANYFVYRDNYLAIFDPDTDPVTSDSIFMAYRWLESGRSIYVVPELTYQHRVNNHGSEEGSHYAANVRRTASGFHEGIVNKLKQMR